MNNTVEDLMVEFDQMQKDLYSALDLKQKTIDPEELKSHLERFFSKFKDTLYEYDSHPRPIERSPSPEPVEEEPEEEEEQDDIKSLLMAKLNETKSKPKPFHYDINKTISVDSYVLNYGTFFPEKLLGSILMVSNQTEDEQVVELTIDSKT